MFENREIDVIPQQHLGNIWLNVLPRLTKGKLRSISRNLVTSQQIQSREDMRDYWMNLHGYKLPENFGKMYCNISFGTGADFGGLRNNDIFCYPIEVSVHCFLYYKTHFALLKLTYHISL